MPIAPRWYQQDAVSATLNVILAGGHPVMMLPTGAGKSVCIAMLCASLPGRILVATHRKELLTQNAEKLPEGESWGIYSAGLKRRDTNARIVFGGIQSVYSKVAQLGDFDAIIVDEAHRIPPIGTQSMYASLFKAYPKARRIGLTATPYRLGDGPIYGTEATWFTSLAYDIGIQPLTAAGFLSPLRGLLTAHNVDVTHVHKRAGEFITSELSQAACQEELVEGTIRELCQYGAHRQSWLVFCVDVAHVWLIVDRLRKAGVDAEGLTGKTPPDERDTLLARMRAGDLRCLVNCEVATTGFDIPRIDLVALLRPTQSKGLLVQMLGRGTRLHEGKADCLCLDFSGNLERHIPVDGLPDAYERTEEREESDEKKAAAAANDRKLPGDKASMLDPFGNSPELTHTIADVYAVVKPSKRQGLQTVLVTYKTTEQKTIALWLFPEYDGWAGEQARSWFARRGVAMPSTAMACARLIHTLPRPRTIVATKSKGFDRVLMEHFSESSSYYDEEQEVTVKYPKPEGEPVSSSCMEIVRQALAWVANERRRYPTYVYSSQCARELAALEAAALTGDEVSTKKAARAYCVAWRAVFQSVGK